MLILLGWFTPFLERRPSHHVKLPYFHSSWTVQPQENGPPELSLSERLYMIISVFLATYNATINDTRGITEISGMCTVDCRVRQRYDSTWVTWQTPSPVKNLVDSFTYHIDNLDESTQLLLTDIHVLGVTAWKLAHIHNHKGDDALAYQDVVFEVLTYRKQPAIDPMGREMRVPKKCAGLYMIMVQRLLVSLQILTLHCDTAMVRDIP